MTGRLLGQVSICCHKLLCSRAQAASLGPTVQGTQAAAQRRQSTLSSSKSRSFEAAGAMASGAACTSHGCKLPSREVSLTLRADVASNTGQDGAQIIDGKAIAQTIREEIKAKVAKLHEATGKVLLVPLPGLLARSCKEGTLTSPVCSVQGLQWS